ncbi:ornithine carbamoyltransferase [Candidatus Oleimmundimicrobium sp.]|uniref:ornithine carbamoyltransferase n=1 Tax=Candidatus Oleimmundimicrobium sp. TaxID=3060597 RepID=UPI00271DDAA4|nr:ornithine carbamoyltransferase [Candidatus Oleimmundimicrobium sp.]MDO8886115.1 ornithine carbamoyltransferase [Candidatus Oleimmundimicrobium sp.]
MISLKGKDFLTLADFGQDEIYQILAKASKLKRLHRLGEPTHLLKGKSVALIFEKPSTRTRVSFEAGIAQLGAHPVVLHGKDLQLGRGETIEDTGRVLSKYVDAIVVRTFKQSDLENLAKAASVPVINGLTDDFHPCQVIADFLTILEKKDRLAGLKMAYVGDGNNVCHSLMLGASHIGMNLSVATPLGYEPKEYVIKKAKSVLRNINHKIDITNNPKKAVLRADVVYTDVWTSMGQESESEERKKTFLPYQVNSVLLSLAKPDALIMHCLPAHRGEEITGEVMESPNCVVFDQAENRMHAQKALLSLLIGD